MLSNAAERDQGVRVSERPAPAIEADRTSEQRDGFVAQRLGVEGRPAEALSKAAVVGPVEV